MTRVEAAMAAAMCWPAGDPAAGGPARGPAQASWASVRRKLAVECELANRSRLDAA